MKLAIFFALLALTFAQNPAQYQLHIPSKCEDVLAVKVCDRLRNTAATLKLKSEEVKNAVVSAYQQGKVKAEEVEKAVNDFLVNKVLNKKCEDLTSVENCNKLRELAAEMKIQADKVAEFIVKQIAILKTKTCEDMLDADNCNKLRDLAGKLKIKADALKEMVIASYIKTKANAKQAVVEAYNKVKDYVMATKCEDMFNPDLCASFRKYAEKTKVALPRIMETAFELAKKGIAIGKGFVEKVYNIVDYFYDCEDVFDKESCIRIRGWAAKVSVTAEKVELLIKKYVRIFIEKSTTIYQTIKKYVQDKIYCKLSPSCQSDDADDEIADLAINKRSLLGDWKNKVMEALNNKFPNLEPFVRKHLEEFVAKSKSLFQFMKQLALLIQDKAFAKYQDILKQLMMEATL